MAENNKELSVKDEDGFIKQAREEMKESEAGMEKIVAKALDDIKMILGENQWDQDIREYRKKLIPPRPCLTQNLFPAFIDQVVNEQRKQRPAVRCVPVDDNGDDVTANVIAGLIRNIDYQSQADAIRDSCFDNVVMASFGAYRVHAEYADEMSFDQELRVLPIENPLALRWDMKCKKFDTSDKKFCYIPETLTKAEFKRRYPKKKSSCSADELKGNDLALWFAEDIVTIAERWYTEEEEETLVQLPDGTTMIKPNESILRQIFKKFMMKGDQELRERKTKICKVRSSIISGAEILEGPFEWPGKYIPVMIAFGKVLNLNGEKHLKSLIRDGKETQRIHNYLITSMIEAYAMQPSAPYVGTDRQFENHPEWDRANEGGISKLTYTADPQAPGSPQRQMPPAISNQLFPMVEGNKATLKDIFGIHQAGLGMMSNETSGRAINARKAESDTGSYVFMSNFLYALQFEGRVKADLIPHYYDTKRAIMITGVEGEHKRIFINQQSKDGKIYDIKAGKYDVIITTGPNYQTQRDETLATMTDLMQPTMAANPAAGSVLLMEIVKLVNTPNADRLQKLMKATLDPKLQAIMDQEDGMGGEGEQDPKLAAMQQGFEQQMEAVVMQLQQVGIQAQQLQQAVQAGEQQIAAKEQELTRAQAEFELAKREIQLHADEAIVKAEIKADAMTAQMQTMKSADDKVQALVAEIKQVKDVVQSLDRALEMSINAKGKEAA